MLGWLRGPPPPEKRTRWDDVKAWTATQVSAIRAIPAPTLAIVLSASALAGCGGTFVHKRFFQRIRNADSITPNMYKPGRGRWIRGYVTSVGDADNFRCYHMAGIGWGGPWKYKTEPTGQKELVGNTIHIRIAGVDAPEGPHFGRPGQDHYQESRNWLTERLLRKEVYIQFLSKDHYGRMVALVYFKPLWLPGALMPIVPESILRKACLSFDMLRSGQAVAYENTNAQYGRHSKEDYFAAQAEAEESKVGIWADGPLKETPAEYKKRVARLEAAVREEPAASAASSADSVTARGREGTSRKVATVK